MNEYESRENLPQGLEFIESVSWDQVVQTWKADEDSDSFRREYKDQGFETWESWRKIIIEPLHLDQPAWERYSVADPAKTVPTFRGGPFMPWKELYYGDIDDPTFAQIVENSNSDVETRDKFANIIASEKPITLMGLRRGRDIYIVEGMHRSTAIALAAKRGLEVKAPVELLLAETDLDQFQMIP